MNIKKNPVSDEHWSWIKHRLLTKGFRNFISLAKKYNYSPNAFRVTKGYAYPQIEKIIANEIGMTPQDLFPDRYTSDGKPLGRNYPRDRRLSERKKLINGKDEEGICHEAKEQP